jgi:two-component system sensor histidine kinase/response regulator
VTEPVKPPFDDAALARLRRFGGEKLLGEMVLLFFEHAPTRADAARAGVANGDANAVRMALHALKSSAAQLGAMRLHDICAEGEARAGRGMTDGLQQVVADLDAELPRACEWLDKARTG